MRGGELLLESMSAYIRDTFECVYELEKENDVCVCVRAVSVNG